MSWAQITRHLHIIAHIFLNKMLTKYCTISEISFTLFERRHNKQTHIEQEEKAQV